ncbi:MAG: bifunctional diaminohydroxyphosphoribosylaminopyrimidine deaminase/5-amino-6-(5-phosphoribosylamino)uracil reductase RibD [Acidobacteria bacterium]|nr:bifunctional diaminohydroxyphosphoribosylaminopyrimidine deaminase/5-amino-6-(5-phosphoribosylamino)uracil reductase RibD [Acidobacteriota bacterium]
MFNAEDARWMARALELARKGEALCSPNPMVGAVLVKDGRVVGEGFHTYANVKHAEIVALEQARGTARGATLYINLEPCCHTGRTGPCTSALIDAGIERVVTAMPDPNPQVSGRGFRKLRQAGIKVEIGLSQAQAERLTESFSKWIQTGLPLVTMKSALTLDGYIALVPGKTRKGSITWITSEESRAEVQRMRHASDALMTGIGTVLADNPRMSDRTGLPRRRPLLRVILDSKLRLPLRSKLVKSAERDLLVFTSATTNSPRARALRRAGVEIANVRGARRGLDLRAVMKELGSRNITSVLLEGGSHLNAAALASGIVDKVVLFYAPKFLGAGVSVLSESKQLPALRNVIVRSCGPDVVVEGYLRDVYRNR